MGFVAQYTLYETTLVEGIVRIRAEHVFAVMGYEHAHLVEQVDGAQRGVDVCTDDDYGQMAWHTFENSPAEGFFTRGNKNHEGTVGLRMLGTLDEVGEGHEASVTLVAVVGNDT